MSKPTLHEQLDAQHTEALFTNYSGDYEVWLEERVEELEAKLEAREALEEASIEFYCGVIDKPIWRQAVRNSPRGQELIALATQEQ